MVKLVSKRMDVVKRMIDDGVMEEARKCGGMKKLVDSRMEYNTREPSFDDVMEICRSSSKRMKICGEFNSLDVAGNPREQRKVHELRMQKWKDESVSSSAEMERFQALKDML